MSSQMNKSGDGSVQLELEINVSFALSCVVLAFAILGAFTNFISIVVYSHQAMRSSINVLLTGLSIIDMCLCIFAVPTFVIPPMCIYYNSQSQETNPSAVLCNRVVMYSTLYVYPLTTMTQTCSVYAFVVITFERWIAVCHPFRARWASTGRSLRALAVVCFLAVAYNLVRFFEHVAPSSKLSSSSLRSPNETLPDNQTGSENSVEEFLRKDEYYMKVYYSGLYLVTHFLVPFSVLTIVNGKMVYSIHQARQQRQLLSHSEKKEHRTAAMMGAVVLMFVCSNSLTFVLNFIEQVDKQLFLYPSSTKLLMFILNDVSNLLVLINAAATIGFYYSCSQKYRQLLHYYVANFWCTSCITVVYPRIFEDSQSRLQASRIGFSFQTALTLYPYPTTDHSDGRVTRGMTSTCNSRRGSAIEVERSVNGSPVNQGGHGSIGVSNPEERKCLISNGKYLDPNRTPAMQRGKSASHLAVPAQDRDHLTVPSVQQYSRLGPQRQCSQLSLRNIH